MTSIKHDPKDCEEILLLLNELIDGDITPERKKKAKDLIRHRPECQSMYNTLLKTIQLYRTRRDEVSQNIKPRIIWDSDNLSDHKNL